MFPLKVRTISESGSGNGGKQGTGWFLRSNLIVTAFHVVGVEGNGWLHELQPCDYTLQPGGEKLLPLCYDSKADVALMECVAPPNNVTILQPAKRLGIGTSWRARGFRRALEGKGFVLTGKVIEVAEDVLAESTLQLMVDQGSDASWEGMSGSAVCVGGRVAGVLTQEVPRAETLYAASITPVLWLLALYDAAQELEREVLALSEHPETQHHLREMPVELLGARDLTSATELARSLKKKSLQGDHGTMRALVEELAERGLATELQTVRRLLSKPPPHIIIDRMPRVHPGINVEGFVETIVQEHLTPFVGRAAELTSMDALLEQASGALVVLGRAGLGKTALLANWLRQQTERQVFVAYHFFSALVPETCDPVGFYRNLLRQIYEYHELDPTGIPYDQPGLKESLVAAVREPPQEATPLVLLVDGLDEFDSDRRGKSASGAGLRWPFGTKLPPGVYVIASARNFGVPPDWLQSWLDHVTASPPRLNSLSDLDQDSVGDYLRATGVLRELAEETARVTRILTITQGFPLYLKHLTDDLVRAVQDGQSFEEVLQRTPHKFADYIKTQVKELVTEELPDKALELLDLLTVTKGRISCKDLMGVLGLKSRDLIRIDDSWRLTRWLYIVPTGQDRYYSFQHPLLAELFAEEAEDESKQALERLLQYCARWSTTESLYALKYYPIHLLEARENRRLIELGMDDVFLDRQAQAFPSELLLPLNTLEMARQAADVEDDAVGLAGLTLSHAYRVFAIQAIARDEAQRGDALRALATVELYEPADQIIWILLLAWRLRDEGRLGEAKAALDRLLSVPMPSEMEGWKKPPLPGDSNSGWEGEYIAFLLAQVAPLGWRPFATLQRLLAGHARLSLALHLLNSGDAGTAEEVLASPATVEAESNVADQNPGGGLPLERNAEVLRDELLFKTAQSRLTQQGPNQAEATAQKLQNPSNRVRVLLEIADRRIDDGLPGIPDLLNRIEDECKILGDVNDQITGLFCVFWLRERIGDSSSAQAQLIRIQDMAKERRAIPAYLDGLLILIDSQLKRSLVEKARANLSGCTKLAASIPEADRRAHSLLEIARRQEEAKDADAVVRALRAAEEAVREIQEGRPKSELLARIGWLGHTIGQFELANKGFDSARAEALALPNDDEQYGALLTIAEMKLRARVTDAASAYSEAISRTQHWAAARRCDAMAEAAQSRLGAGEPDAARTMFTSALEASAQIYDPGERCAIRRGLADSLRTGAQLDLARCALRLAEQDAAKITDSSKMVEETRKIAVLMTEFEDPKAHIAWERALNAIDSSSDHQIFKNLYYFSLARESIRCGILDIATRAVNARGSDYFGSLELATAQALRGDNVSAQQSLFRALAPLSMWSDNDGPAHVLAGLGWMLTEEQDDENADNCFKAACNVSSCLQPLANRIVVTWEIGDYLCHAHRPESAERTFRSALALVEQLPADRDKYLALRKVLDAQLRNPLDDSFAYIWIDDLPQYSTFSLEIVRTQLEAVIHASMQRRAEAELAFARTVALARLSPGEVENVLIDNALLQAQLGMREAAKTSLDEAMRHAKQPPVYPASVERVALAFAWIGEHEEAMQNIDRPALRFQLAAWVMGFPEFSRSQSESDNRADDVITQVQRQVIQAITHNDPNARVSELDRVLDLSRERTGDHWIRTQAALAVALGQAKVGAHGRALSTLQEVLLADPSAGRD
jgi:AAA ATPase domain/Trypsin-like peptidase domain